MATITQCELERAARRISDRIAAEGYRALWAGGCVRDRLMGRPPKDIDIATNATPDEVAKLFPKTKGVGKSFGVILVPSRRHWFEVATFRRDLGYEDGRRPVAVEFAGEKADALRRDFTVNGLFFDPATGRVLDYIGGRRDVRERRIRAIGDPRERFAEDYLRMLRAVRFASTLEFAIERSTLSAIRELAGRIRSIAAERTRDELIRILVESPKAGQGIALLHEAGLLREILPEIAAMEGVEQPPDKHPEGDVLTHTLIMLDLMDPPVIEVALAALFHDSGKPETRTIEPSDDGGRIRFHGHETVSAKIAERALRRLKFPRRIIETVVACVASHGRFFDIPKMRPATLRRWMAQPEFDIAYAVHKLDKLSCGRPSVVVPAVERERAGMQAAPALPRPLIRGPDVIALGAPPGPAVGRWIRVAHDRQIENPELDREALLAWLADAIRDEGQSLA